MTIRLSEESFKVYNKLKERAKPKEVLSYSIDGNRIDKCGSCKKRVRWSWGFCPDCGQALSGMNNND